MAKRKATPKPQTNFMMEPDQWDGFVNPFTAQMDPIHANIRLDQQQLVQDVYNDKYRYGDEKHMGETFRRVALGVYPNPDDVLHALTAYQAMYAGLWMPGGRILAGAGTSKRVTLM